MRYAAVLLGLILCLLIPCARVYAVTCYGIDEGDPGVCSGRGICVAEDTCECQPGYLGNQCEFIEGSCPFELTGDVNHDCLVDMLDFEEVGRHWLIDCLYSPEDPNCQPLDPCVLGMSCGTGQVCEDGQCVCAAGLTRCGDECVYIDSDRDHCGSCGHSCSAGQVCNSGVCQLSCQAGLTNCGGICVNLQTDRSHCGSCYDPCPVGEVCSGGMCALSCQAGLTNCNGVCVNLQTDRENCGLCGYLCPAGQVCNNGTCQLSCQTGLTNCSGNCVNLQTDRSNCGGCGQTCDPGEVCNNGICQLSCQAGLTNCGGMCVNLNVDESNCGGCGRMCDPGEVCDYGTCELVCPPTLTNCSGQCVDLSYDPQNCGSCGQDCTIYPHVANGYCLGGMCGYICEAGYGDCDSSPGCETNTDTDSSNCGQCGNACDPGAFCSSGTCIAF